MIKQCLVCGKDFKPHIYDVKKGMGKYCSLKCYYKSIESTTKTKCVICGKEFSCKPSRIGTVKTCSYKCRGVWQSRNNLKEKAPCWKGGLIDRICKNCGIHFKSERTNVRSGNGKFCSHSCSAIHTVLKGKNKDTSIEIKIEQELIRRGIVYRKQYPIKQAGTILDFFIAPNICIYCDGDFWHNIPRQIIRDKNHDFKLKFLGYKVYRFWQHDINESVSECVNRIKRLSEGR